MIAVGAVCSPFWDKRVNYLDCLCCLSIIIHCVAALYYNNLSFLPTPGAAALDVILVIVNFATWAAIVGLFLVSFAQSKLRQRSIRTLVRNVARTAVKLQLQLRACKQSFLELLAPHLQGDNVYLDGFQQAAAESLRKEGMVRTRVPWVLAPLAQ